MKRRLHNALVGAAFTAVATSLITLVVLGSLSTLDQYRFWSGA